MNLLARIGISTFLLGLACHVVACSDDTSSADASPSPDSGAPPPSTPPPTPETPDAGEDGAEHLVVADPKAGKLYVYAAPDYAAPVSFDVTFADHPGFLPLGNGNVAFIESTSGDLVVLHATGTPAIAKRVPVVGTAAHLATDEAHRYVVVSATADDGKARGAFTMVDLTTYESRTVRIATGEPGLALTGSPLHLLHRNDDPAQIEAYDFMQLWAGTVTVGPKAAIGSGPHGEVIAHARKKMVSAADDGINVVSFENGNFGSVSAIPYDVSGRTGGRAFYARLSADGRYLYSYLRDDGYPADVPWSDWKNDAYVVDLDTQTAKRLPIGNGLAYRLADCTDYAIFVQYSPDGDFAHLLDTKAGSPTFQTFVGKVPLEAMSAAPTATGSPWESKAFRIAGMLPSCDHAFATHGGDGKVSVIDPRTRSVVKQITVPTPLDGGGYLIGIGRGTSLADTIGR